MAELVSGENLQPSLLDRLTDRSRFVERITLAYLVEALAAAGGTADQIREMLGSLGLRRVRGLEQADVEVWDNHSSRYGLRSILELRPRPELPPLADLIEVRGRQLVPNVEESREERLISSRRLRQLVLRDLGWLLNTGQLTAVVPMENYPEVRRSVLNYGVPDLAGMSVSGADLQRLAESLRLAITTFEPRLRHVSVTPLDGDQEGRQNRLSFRIAGELWGQPLPEQLYLHTEFDLEDATVTVHETDNR
ncbi:type VI secretion system baseplate subunit TssE [Aquisalimonas sp.]|uniref:type VI secretion system baseplate subunit TssE n=1 Tax=Aquisalimonas sp. TaxID=1872621 RepID=UPI0025BC4F26|nr:type VI secretion system baseplate subunit TssE [Aquisalimonas sp.]